MMQSPSKAPGQKASGGKMVVLVHTDSGREIDKIVDSGTQ
jgi:hypothetical protein